MGEGAPATAVITGASSGIGAAFARQLAARGHALVLVARREERLQALADELHRRHGVGVEILVADLARPEGIARVQGRLAAGGAVDVLVNNAGFGTVGPFAESDLERQLDMISVHVTATARLTRAVLPGMIARGRGAVINVSSIAASLPAPGNATYSATKAYVKVFSQGLATELQGTGVRVQALCPGFTRTEFHSTPEYRALEMRSRVPKWLWMDPEEVVTASLDALARGKVVLIPGLRNRWVVALGQGGPGARLMRAVARRLRRMVRRAARIGD